MGAMAEGERIELRRAVTEGDPLVLGSFLETHTGLSRRVLKDALTKGALRLARAGDGRLLRVRKADTAIAPGDRVEYSYDAEILARVPPEASLLLDLGAYSIWLKPAGLLSQGNAFGDHCSILRAVEVWARGRRRAATDPPGKARETYLLHRLDRETIGVMAFAHGRKAAAEGSRVFASGGVRKVYRAEVHGRIEARSGPAGIFDSSLDGKSAHTRYELVSYDAARDRSVVSVTIRGGRLHQIRRHFAAARFPVVGDPRYGWGDGEPMRLAVTALGFSSALLGRDVEVTLSPEQVGF